MAGDLHPETAAGLTGLAAFLERRPVVSAILVVPAMWLVSAAVFAVVTGFGHAPLEQYSVRRMLVSAAPAIVFILLLKRRGWLSRAGFTVPQEWRDVHLIWLPCLLVLVNLSNLIGKDIVAEPEPGVMAFGFLRACTIALQEETVFRGLMLTILLQRYHETRRQVLFAVAVSSALFGLAHFPNDPDLETNAAQWITAICAGFGFAAVLLRTGSLWLLIGVHVLIITANITVDTLVIGEPRAPGTGPRENVGWSALASIAAALPMLLYGLYLLRDTSAVKAAWSAEEPRQS